MTDQITVPRATWDAMREALEHIQRCIGFDKATIHQGSATWYEIDDAITAANAVSDHFRGVTEMVQPLGWYCVSRDGLATQCADQRDAEVTAESADRDWPNSAPYRAVQLCEFEAHPQATEPAEKEDPLQGAVDWLLQADGEFFAVATVQRTLRIGYNRAKRLADIARERAAAPEAKQ